MKASLLIFLCVMLAGPMRAGTLADLDSQDGFRDARFGASVESFKGLVEVNSYTNRNGITSVFYKRPSDELKMEDIAIKEIQYEFVKGRLVAVYVRVRGEENRRRLLEQLLSSYGQLHYSFESLEH